MILKTKAPRWYQWKDGQISPCYELPKKSGNGMKSYSLAEARKDKALISVTSVLKVIDRPQLNDYRVRQAIYSALTLPRIDGETPDAFAERVLVDSETQSNEAAEFGNRIHDEVAKIMQAYGLWNRTKEPFDVKIHPDVAPYLQDFILWALNNIEQVHGVEVCVGHPSLGVAGRMDLNCTLRDVGRAIVDVKSQAIKDNPIFYSEWAPQLSAYSKCLTKECGNPNWKEPRIMSLVIRSNEPGPVHPRLWTEEEQDSAWNVFQAALTIWINGPGRGYDPRH